MLLSLVMNLGFAWGAPAAPAPEVTTTTPSGVRKGKKRPVVINLSDVKNRQDTAEYIKEQLRLRYPDLYQEQVKSPFDAIREKEEKKRLKALQKRETRMREEALKLEAEQALKTEQERKRRINNQIIIMLMSDI